MNEIVNERAATYGDPIEMYTRSAAVVSGILGTEVQPWQVPLIMAGLKLVRTSITPDYSDNSDDVDGYMDIFRTLMGEDMIHARSAAEYQARKADDSPRCVNCKEPASMHDPISGKCQARGFAEFWFEMEDQS